MRSSLVPWFNRGVAPWEGRSGGVFGDLRREMDRLFDQFLTSSEEGGVQPMFVPRVNVAETEENYDITFDLPGMKAEDFNVELKDNALTIMGERKEESEENGKTYHRIERHYGQFRRVIPLESSVDAEKIQAEYKDGVLHVTVPKDEASQPRRIPVKA